MHRALPLMCVLLQFAPGVVHGSEPSRGFFTSSVRRKALAHELLGAHVEMRANLGVDIARDDVVAPQRRGERISGCRGRITGSRAAVLHADFGAAVRMVVTVSE